MADSTLCPISDEEQPSIAERLGGLDVLVHAAGIAPSSLGGATTPEVWNRIMSINALGTMLTSQAAFWHLKEHGAASSTSPREAGVAGLPNKSAYAASKGAVLGFTRTAAAEWARYGITVNAIAPAIWTPMYDRTRSEMTPEQLAGHDAMMAQAVPLGGKLGDIDIDIDIDLVPVMAFYSSAGAGFMTGQMVSVDGGTLMVR